MVRKSGVVDEKRLDAYVEKLRADGGLPETPNQLAGIFVRDGLLTMFQAEQMVYTRRILQERIAYHTGQPFDKIEEDSDRDRWFTAEEAKEYGFVDHVVTRANQVPSAGAVS